MVNDPDYPNGFPLFSYDTPERTATVVLRYPEDGSQPPTLAQLRDLTAAEVQKLRDEGAPSDFLEQALAALDAEIARKKAAAS
jgi:hypothetical protein